MLCVCVCERGVWCDSCTVVVKAVGGCVWVGVNWKTTICVDSHLENDANQVSAVFLAKTCLNCARSPSDSSSMTVSSC